MSVCVYAAPDSSANAGLPVLLFHPKPKTPARCVKTTAMSRPVHASVRNIKYKMIFPFSKTDMLHQPAQRQFRLCDPARHSLPSQPPGGPDLKKIYTQPDTASPEAPETLRNKPNEKPPPKKSIPKNKFCNLIVIYCD